MNTKKIDRKQTLMVAHRGVSKLEQENTTLAFVAAGNRSYFGIETDVHVTRDGQFVAIHDSNTLRVSGDEYIVEETDFKTLRELRLFDLDGSHTREDIRIPTLEEYIAICKKYEKVAVLELKNAMTEEVVAQIVERIRQAEYLDRVIFIAFNFDNLVYVRRHSSNQPVQYLIGKVEVEENLARAKAQGFDVDIYYKVLTEEIVRDLHEAGLRVNCWTVDEPADAETLVAWGVDFITTNILE